MFRNPGFLWPIIVILIIVIVWIIRPCPQPPPVEFDSNLVLTTRSVGSWMPFTNVFHTLAEPDDAPWNGLLIQLGTYNGVQSHYDELRLTRQGQLVHNYFWNKNIWVNVVSENAGFSEPMTPEEALRFFPNDNPCEVCCLDAETAAKIDSSCLRNQKIHAGMLEVNALITYWRGQEGYDLQTRRSGDSRSRDRFEFDFLDEYRVDVYELMEEEVDKFAFVLQDSWTSDEVDLITAVTQARDPDDWEKQEPPMPGEGP